jgi:maleylacetoacetate isomerase
MVLYSNYVNSAGERVRIALALKGLDYDYISIGQIGWDAYEAVNPQRLAPALKIGEAIIPQSSAILEYLEETHPEPALLPADPVLRAQARGFAQHVVSEMHAVDVIRIRRFLGNELNVSADGIAHWQQHWFAKGFTALEALLARRPEAWPFCFGDRPGWADLHLVPQMRKGLTRFGVGIDAYPLLYGVFQRCADLPEFIAAMPENQPDWPGRLIEPTMDGDGL